MSNTLEAREQVVDLCLHLVRRGFFAATGGNLALRLDAERIAVTPSALDYYQMGAEDVCILRLADLHQLEGDRAPSVETGLHARVLRRFPAAGCSLHTHQPLASACTLLGEALSVDDPERWPELGRRLPLVGYAPSGTGWLAKRLDRALSAESPAYLLRNHGVLCYGASARQTLAVLEQLEAFCEHYLVGRIANRPGVSAADSLARQRLLTTLTASLPS
ncbi:class II aldolase/adducin family protein [Pseudomonas oryzihabitans]|uniref:Aldolase n=1 Tax=Pseudomonas oryzihabitans TaxID=47885 RepID=A0A2Z5ADA4_9PSED|nr:class II aldolase/adducin family protein [Pseudomonas oryzihabitans]AXA67301.1 aldolase [Pseudomonas oryzihabitans]